MILGRLIGCLVSAGLVWLYPDYGALGLLVAALLGLFIGLLASYWVGPMLKANKPDKRDGEDYWTGKFGPELGKSAYQLWLSTYNKPKPKP